MKALTSPQVSKCMVGTYSPKPASFLSCLTPSYTVSSQQRSILHLKYFKTLSLSLHPTSWSRLHHLHPLKASRLLFITPLPSWLSTYLSENTQSTASAHIQWLPVACTLAQPSPRVWCAGASAGDYPSCVLVTPQSPHPTGHAVSACQTPTHRLKTQFRHEKPQSPGQSPCSSMGPRT